MYSLLKLFFDICIFKKGPQDIPSSKWLFRVLILTYASISFIILFIDNSFAKTFQQAVVGTVFILLASKVILIIANKSERYLQTTCALLATDSLISFFAIPAMATLILEGTDLAFLSVLLLMLWHWLVTGHVFKHALQKPFTFGLGVAFLYILVSYQVMALFFPEIIVNK